MKRNRILRFNFNNILIQGYNTIIYIVIMIKFVVMLKFVAKLGLFWLKILLQEALCKNKNRKLLLKRAHIAKSDDLINQIVENVNTSAVVHKEMNRKYCEKLVTNSSSYSNTTSKFVKYFNF